MILVDKSLLNLALESDLGLQLHDILIDRVAQIVTTDFIIGKLEPQLESLKAPLDAIWRDNLNKIRSKYFEMLSTGGNLENALGDVSVIAAEISKVITRFNTKIDREETELLAAATWLRRNLSIEPVLVSDDRDVLSACHLFSSFFGLVISVLSSFELLRLVGDNSLVEAHCAHFSLTKPVCHYDKGFQVTDRLVHEVDLFARKGFLAIHPRIPPDVTVTKITKKQRKSSL